MNTVQIVTSADRKFFPLIPVFLLFAARSNPGQAARVIVDDQDAAQSFLTRELVQYLGSQDFHFGFETVDRALVGQPMNKVRFLQRSVTESDYIYISDIDVFLTRSVIATHSSFLDKTGLPFSNILRPNSKRLTGLHFHKSGDYESSLQLFGDSWTRMNRFGDERILFEIVQSGFDQPLEKITPSAQHFRPIPGLHVSLFSRLPGAILHKGRTIPGWTGAKQDLDYFIETVQDPSTQEYLSSLPPASLAIVHLTLAWCFARVSDPELADVPAFGGSAYLHQHLALTRGSFGLLRSIRLSTKLGKWTSNMVASFRARPILPRFPLSSGLPPKNSS